MRPAKSLHWLEKLGIIDRFFQIFVAFSEYLNLIHIKACSLRFLTNELSFDWLKDGQFSWLALLFIGFKMILNTHFRENGGVYICNMVNIIYHIAHGYWKKQKTKKAKS